MKVAPPQRAPARLLAQREQLSKLLRAGEASNSARASTSDRDLGAVPPPRPAACPQPTAAARGIHSERQGLAPVQRSRWGGHMEWKPRMWPTFAAEVLEARASLRLGDEIGLAFRAERQRLGMSQRAYAAHRGSVTLGAVIRPRDRRGLAEAGRHRRGPRRHDGSSCASATDRLTPNATDAALPSSGCRRRRLAIRPRRARRRQTSRSGGPVVNLRGRWSPSLQRTRTPRGSRSRYTPTFWPRAELVARVRGGGRRVPGRTTSREQVDVAPPWWWYAESSRAGTKAPNWYAPQYTQRLGRLPVRPGPALRVLRASGPPGPVR